MNMHAHTTMIDKFYLIRDGDVELDSRRLILTEGGMKDGIKFQWVFSGDSSSEVSLS